MASRVRPGDPGWPSDARWDELKQAVRGRLIKVRSPLAACLGGQPASDCADLFRQIQNPYFLGDEVGLTQSLGWVGAWTSQPSVYAVAARTTADVVAAVNFARQHGLRLVVKGGGHSYQGRSNAPDSLLIWTRHMNAITLQEGFVPAGCEGRIAPAAAVTAQAGAIWQQAYDAVTTKGGRYVQGGGCLTVGVAGLVQSGGFGSFSKTYGLAAASLLEAEIVTGDGAVRIANACTHPDLFWAIKGGGSCGVITRLTLRTHALPNFFGGVFAKIRAASNDAYRELIGRIIDLYGESLFSPHWGEQIAFRPDNTLEIAMVFQGLDQEQARAVWRPFFDSLASTPEMFAVEGEPTIIAVPARQFWDPVSLKQIPGLVLGDDRPGAPDSNLYWAGNQAEAGQVIHGYQSTWLPADLLTGDARGRLSDALFAASRHWRLSLHCNKGLAGAPADAIAAAQDTVMNPAVLNAFALLICGASGPPAYPGVHGHEPDPAAARRHAEAIGEAMTEIRNRLPTSGAYVSESNFFEERWQKAFWGSNYARLLGVKDRYDPEGLFFVHHGVGSERWSPDGFSML